MDSEEVSEQEDGEEESSCTESINEDGEEEDGKDEDEQEELGEESQQDKVAKALDFEGKDEIEKEIEEEKRLKEALLNRSPKKVQVSLGRYFKRGVGESPATPMTESPKRAPMTESPRRKRKFAEISDSPTKKTYLSPLASSIRTVSTDSLGSNDSRASTPSSAGRSLPTLEQYREWGKKGGLSKKKQNPAR